MRDELSVQVFRDVLDQRDCHADDGSGVEGRERAENLHGSGRCQGVISNPVKQSLSREQRAEFGWRTPCPMFDACSGVEPAGSGHVRGRVHEVLSHQEQLGDDAENV